MVIYWSIMIVAILVPIVYDTMRDNDYSLRQRLALSACVIASVVVVVAFTFIITNETASANEVVYVDDNGAVGGIDTSTPVTPKATTIDGTPITAEGGDGAWSGPADNRQCNPTKGVSVLPKDNLGPGPGPVPYELVDPSQEGRSTSMTLEEYNERIEELKTEALGSE